MPAPTTRSTTTTCRGTTPAPRPWPGPAPRTSCVSTCPSPEAWVTVPTSPRTGMAHEASGTGALQALGRERGGTVSAIDEGARARALDRRISDATAGGARRYAFGVARLACTTSGLKDARTLEVALGGLERFPDIDDLAHLWD